jgi:hypothetical protein
MSPRPCSTSTASGRPCSAVTAPASPRFKSPTTRPLLASRHAVIRGPC